MQVGFRCKVCSTINTKLIRKQTYETGVVIVRCDGCANNHLVADRVGWFVDGGTDIEQLVRARGQSVTKGTVTPELKLRAGKRLTSKETPPTAPEVDQGQERSIDRPSEGDGAQAATATAVEAMREGVSDWTAEELQKLRDQQA